MEIFQNKIKYYGYTNLNATTLYCGNPALNGSEFFNKQYCSNNFNHFMAAIILLFQLLVVNQWHDILSCSNYVNKYTVRVHVCAHLQFSHASRESSGICFPFFLITRESHFSLFCIHVYVYVIYMNVHSFT